MPENYTCTVVRSQRKTVSLRIVARGQVEVRVPLQMTQAQIEAFLARHRAWIEKHLRLFRQHSEAESGQAPSPYSAAELNDLAHRTAALISPRVRLYAARLGVSYSRVSVRYQKSQWGSCSSKGNLSFNCLLALCPEDVVDYVVVHELCHRKEMNHSPRFWALVQSVLPDYARRRQWLKTEGQKIISRPVGNGDP